jgi:hypothetical protein
MTLREQLEKLQIRCLEVQLETHKAQLENTQSVGALLMRKVMAEVETAELLRDRDRLIGEEVRKAIAANDLPKIKSFNS